MRRFVLNVISAWMVVAIGREGFAQERPRLNFAHDTMVAQAPALPKLPDNVPALPRVVMPEDIPVAPRVKSEPAVVPVAGPRVWSIAEVAPLRPWDNVGVVEVGGIDHVRFVSRSWQEWLFDYRDEMTDTAFRLGDDFRTFYDTPNLLCLGVAVVAAAPVANSHADQGIRDWWQGHVRNDRSDSFFKFGNDQLGRAEWTMPVLIGGAVLGKILEEYPAGGTIREYSVKSLRAIIVGAPALGVLQYGLGGERPEEGSSHWNPIRTHNGASGHAFVGSVPFLTAAYMTDSIALKAVFVAGSLYAPVARINDNRSYFSQVALGYVIAVAATHSVFQTDMTHGRVQLGPLPVQDAVGLSVMMKY